MKFCFVILIGLELKRIQNLTTDSRTHDTLTKSLMEIHRDLMT